MSSGRSIRCPVCGLLHEQPEAAEKVAYCQALLELGDVCFVPSEDGALYGHCRHEAMNPTFVAHNGLHIVGIPDGLRLLYGQDFGCKHHEPKDTDANGN